MQPGHLAEACAPNVFVFNPFAEGYIAQGNGFAPVKHQALLASDLAGLPQFLCRPGDVVLVEKLLSPEFLKTLQEAGFPTPEFVELREGRIDPGSTLLQRQLGGLRPWAWGPDSIKLFEPLFARVASEPRSGNRYFNDQIARLYSKVWSADFLRKVLDDNSGAQRSWLCPAQEAGVAVNTVEAALGAVAAIRGRGHHRVVVKEAHGLAGHNAIRLWEPEVSPEQRQWLAHALAESRQVVVEPWLERELDFSVQLEIFSPHPGGLKLCGFTGLVNDPKGQYLANWAEADSSRRLPARVGELFPSVADVSGRFERLYTDIFSLLEAELQRSGFVGPISLDAFVYRTAQGECRLKPIVEINPRYTMGRLTLELMKHTCPGRFGRFRLISRAQARAAGFAGLSAYASSLAARFPLLLTGEPERRIRQGALCLNSPAQAQVCLATFEVSEGQTRPAKA